MNQDSAVPTREAIQQAAQRLLDGGLVAFPTETVWGLGADAENVDAVARIYHAKGRPANHPVIVHLAPGADISYWAERIPDDAHTLMRAFWPGPLTLILPRAARISAQVSGGQNSIGLRCPSHPVAQELLATFAALTPTGQGGVAAPSANRFGRISATQAGHVHAEFDHLGSDDLLVLDAGPSVVGIESTIVDLSRYDTGAGPVLLRPGHIRAEQLEAVLGRPVGRPDDAAPRVSGSLQSHYAPQTPLQLFDIDNLPALLDNVPSGADKLQTGFAIVARRARPAGLPSFWHWVEMPDEPEAYAARLYATLHALDSGRHPRILVERLPDTAAWQALNDRIQRAAAPRE